MSLLWVRRLFLLIVLIGFVVYAFKFAPPDNGHDASFTDLMLGRGPARNPAIFAAFNLLGVIPLMYWALMASDSRSQRLWAWPFALGMMALGSFALLPYLILRSPAPLPALGRANLLVRWFEGRPFALFVDVALVGLLIYGIGWGNRADYVHWFHVSNFIHVMSLDFILMTLLFPVLIWDDMKRRHVSSASTLGRIALFVPLLGPAVYLAMRPISPPD